MRCEFNAGGLRLRHHPYIAIITNRIRGFVARVILILYTGLYTGLVGQPLATP